MHVMVATDGSLDAAAAAKIATRIAGPSGTVTVMTAVEVPRGLLAEIREHTSQTKDKLTEISVEYQKEQADVGSADAWFGDDTLIEQFVRTRVKDATHPLVDELAKLDHEAEVIGEEAEDVAAAIITAIGQRNVDVLCIGPTGLGRFEGLLGSISTKLARGAPCSVVIVR